MKRAALVAIAACRTVLPEAPPLAIPTAAVSVAAPDGDGRWVVTSDADGVLWRVTASGDREQVGERFGLGTAKVRQVGGAGATTVFDLGDAVAYTIDGVHLVRVPAEPATRFAVARGVVARAIAARPGHAAYVELWNLARANRVTFPIAPTELVFADADTDHPRLVARAGDHVWIEDAGELRAYAAPHGIARVAPDAAWQAQVAPVFQRVCAGCHLPGGDAGVDLSTPAAWTVERAEIAHRVLEAHTMPPAGTELTDADRASLAAWLHVK